MKFDAPCFFSTFTEASIPMRLFVPFCPDIKFPNEYTTRV
ncbi:hypothetical protein HFN_0795 [Helicobacter fennelliae MRY12-0050]|uniref:Uncharacterized protein n=1 Tax=Helicobacter fennelliae MRY12-0050 TaxID=1325130 RepID=T1D053_9HELI|nr:hypothetical protein HFN_0795 [Helicobacter fennelliae MRY12-0050]